MRLLKFSMYYLKLRVGNYLGTHPAHGPLNLRWRWETWHRLKRSERKYAPTGTLDHLRNDLVRIWRMIIH